MSKYFLQWKKLIIGIVLDYLGFVGEHSLPPIAVLQNFKFFIAPCPDFLKTLNIFVNRGVLFVNANDVIKIEIERADIFEAIRMAKGHNFIDNLRHRSPIVSFDSKVRGYLGEIALKKWLRAHNINNFRSNRITNMYICDIDLALVKDGRIINCEIKTSKMPHCLANNSLRSIIDRCDIKIIKRNNTDEIIIDNDVYLQIYYFLSTQEHDRFLIDTYEATQVDADCSVEEIYDVYRYYDYIDKTYLVAWDERNHITQNLLRMRVEEQTYRIAMRTFYSCRLSSAFAPIELIDFLNSEPPTTLYAYGYFYHKNRDCKGIRNIKDSDLQIFDNQYDAIANGFKRCTFSDCN